MNPSRSAPRSPRPRRHSPLAALGVRAACIGLALAGALLPTSCGHADSLRDSVATEIGRWTRYVAAHPDTSGLWPQIKASVVPTLSKAEEAIRDDRVLLALQRLAAVRTYFAASMYVEAHTRSGPPDSASFEREWVASQRMLAAELRPAAAGEFSGLHPAALRALAEAVRPQVRIYREAALDYGRATQPDFGLFYIGQAFAQKEFLGLMRRLSSASEGAAPPVRSIAGDLDSLETEVLAAYRPPASIDRHPEFIGLSAAIKEARELDAAGLRYGALLRYLQAAQRFVPLRASAPALDGATVRAKLADWERRFAAPGTDHSIARLFVETAAAELAGARADSVPPVAAAIVADVLPRYLEALGPALPAAPRVAAQATVTLVRWPYT